MYSKRNPQEQRRDMIRLMERLLTQEDSRGKKLRIKYVLNHFLYATGASIPKTREYYEIVINKRPHDFEIDEEEGYITFLPEEQIEENMRKAEALRQLKIGTEQEQSSTAKSEEAAKND